MRLALAQINPAVGDLDGNRELIVAAARRGKRRRPTLLLPELAVTSLPARGSAPAAGLRPRGRGSLLRDRPRGERTRRPRRRPALRPRPLQRVRRLRRRRGEGRLPQALPAELRRLRRGPLLRARERAACCSSRRDARRADHLRGHVAAGAARHRPRARGRTAADEHLGLAVPRRPRPRAGGDVRHSRARQRLLRRLLQRGRRPGRADLRRPLAGARRGGPRARARARLRGGAAGRRHRPGRRGRPPAPRRPPARARPRARTAARCPVVAVGDCRSHGDRIEPFLAEPLASSSRCGSHSSSGCATTSARTASARSSSASRAGSTPR